MNTMMGHEDTRVWVMTAVALGVTVGLYAWIGDDEYQAAVKIDELREARAVSLAAGVCLPRPGQRTVWQWQGAGDDARLRCVVFDLAADPQSPRVVLDATPAGLDRLALFTGSRP